MKHRLQIHNVVYEERFYHLVLEALHRRFLEIRLASMDSDTYWGLA